MKKSHNNLKRKIIIALFLVFTISVNFLLFSHLIDQSNSSIKDQEKNFELYNLKVSGQEINITSPENKTYTRPMGGYYPATYGFENDIISAPPQGLSSEVGTGTIIEVIDQLDGHNMITRLYDGAIGVNNYANLSHTFSPKSTGVIEFWFRRSGIQEVIFFELWNETNYGLTIYSEDWSGGLAFEYYNGTDYVTIMSHNSDQWYHHRLDFDCINGTFDWYIDGVLRGDDLLLRDPTPYFVRFTVRTRGWGSTGYNAYIDGLGLSWDINYNIGDNLNKGLLLSYDNSTNLDWQGYSLDGQPNKTILGNSAIPMPDYGVHNIQVFGNDTFGTYHQSDLVHFSYAMFRLDSPENITYTSPMSGYYPATYGFENTNDGSFPTGWLDSSTGGNSPQIIGNLGTHKKVFELYDIDTGVAQVTKDLTDQTNGTIEFWWRTTDSSKIQYFLVIDDGTATLAFQIDLSTYSSVQNNIWYHVRVDFDCGTDTYDWYVNNVLEANSVAFISGVTEIDRIKFSTSLTPTNYYAYFDALSLSWDPNYNIGDNLDEGLLLSFENSSALEWMGYSLDNQANKTILGSTTIPFPNEGIHTIQLFGNKSLGIIHQSDLQYFSVNYLPIVMINSPNQDEIFGPTAPSFNISVTESFLNETWYTLDKGVMNISFIGSTGIINQTEWDAQLDGPITIRFYANDTSGLENFEVIIVIKDTSAPIISINNPIADKFFGEITPFFSINVLELSLNTTWYTLDNGASNISFTGLTGSINQMEWDKEIEGPISIRFYANDTFGYINHVEINVYKDITDPVITIHSPSFGNAYTVIPPAFNVSVEELNYDSMWYTIDGGQNNYNISQFTGYIDSTAWNTAPIGAITIRFYAQDKAGNIVYEDIIIQKNSPPIPPEPPDYTLITIIFGISSIGGISVVGVVVYNKKYKAARQIKKLEKKRLKHLKLEKIQQERERIKLSKLEQAKLRREKLELERLERQRWEQERVEKLEEEARLRREKLEQERLEQEKREQERIRKLEEEARKAEKETFERIRKIMSVSSRIKIDMVRKYLNLDQDTFNSKVIDWAAQFGFTIDGEYLNIRKESVPDFIDELEKQFSQWGKDEQRRESKM